MSSSYTPPSGPQEPSQDGSPDQGPQEYVPAYGAPTAREGTSVKTAILLIGLAALLGLLLLGALLWAITRVAPTLLPGGGGEDLPAPPPTTAVAQPTATQDRESTTSPSVAASNAQSPARTTEPPRAMARSGNLEVPTEGALFGKKGAFEETVLEEKSEFAIEVPDHDGPLLITWSVASDRENAGVFLNAYESKGGDMTEHLGAVNSGQTGMMLIDTDPNAPKTTVIYPEGNSDTEWKVQGFPASEMPRVERGAEITGGGPAVVELPAGEEQDYRFTSEEGVPRVEVYDKDDLSSWTQFEYGTGPVELDVTAGSAEQVIMVHADGEWTLEPR
ncbi:hypothetical protein [Kocuria sp. cx-455]|uniref:hypothetical protein n=1 Tax=Kocuria sp. cx-455 TaxID=2771377 RepID=UPI003D72708C